MTTRLSESKVGEVIVRLVRLVRFNFTPHQRLSHWSLSENNEFGEVGEVGEVFLLS